jgi:hypothetical protein
MDCQGKISCIIDALISSTSGAPRWRMRAGVVGTESNLSASSEEERSATHANHDGDLEHQVWGKSAYAICHDFHQAQHCLIVDLKISNKS